MNRRVMDFNNAGEIFFCKLEPNFKTFAWMSGLPVPMHEIPAIDFLLSKGGIISRFHCGIVTFSEYARNCPINSLMSSLASIKKDAETFLNDHEPKAFLHSKKNVPSENSLAISLERNRKALLDVLAQLQEEAISSVCKATLGSQSVMTEIITKARKLEIEKRAIKDALFFLSSFQRLGMNDVANCRYHGADAPKGRSSTLQLETNILLCAGNCTLAGGC